ncbi:MAG: nucleoside deaminase [Anaerolineales bacterium]|nr:nucleoside deaminase [Anaerolineales bacterium]
MSIDRSGLEFTLNMPDWAEAELAKLPTHVATLAERMDIVNHFAALNVKNDTGGPFAAGIFEKESGKLIVIGVNRVVPKNCSPAHAEVMTIALAQNKLNTFDLGGPGQPEHQMVVNWRPCAMCYGAVVWSGIRSLAIAGSGPELEEITGFDEGPIHPEWQKELEKRGIEVIDGINTEGSIEVFRQFAATGRVVYNGRLGNAD